MSFGNRVLFLRSWTPDKKIEKLKLNAVLVWAKLPCLRLQYFNKYTLRKIGSLLGKPLFMDKATCAQIRMAFARI